MLLAGDFVVSAVLDRIAKLLRHVAGKNQPATLAPPAAAVPPPPLPSKVAPSRAEAAERTLEGSFGVLDLAEVTQAIALGGKTGQLALQLAAGEGTIVFDSGRIVHAEFGGRDGENAFGAMISSAQFDPAGTFRFKPGAELPAGCPRTIQKSVDQLLLSVASEIDEGQATAGMPPPPQRT
jgi:hypothetical protein